MAKVTKRYEFTFEPDEISVLLAVCGDWSQQRIADRKLSVDAFERVYAALSEAAYAPMREDEP